MKSDCVRRWCARKDLRPVPANTSSRRGALLPRARTAQPAVQHWRRVRRESRALRRLRLSASTTAQRTRQARRQRRRQDTRHSMAYAPVTDDAASSRPRSAHGIAEVSQRNRPQSCCSNSLLSGDKPKPQSKSNGDHCREEQFRGTCPDNKDSTIVGFLLFCCQYMI